MSDDEGKCVVIESNASTTLTEAIKQTNSSSTSAQFSRNTRIRLMFFFLR